ncbi:4Fe-4S binding protein [bacterium]|nr:4Fe-4S binding protein [bacterium]
MQRVRTIFQAIVLLATIATGLRYSLGWSRTTIETYCPFGGLETALSLITQKQFACATGERNLALFLGLLILTLLTKKSFCSWICPVGTVSEWCMTLSRILFPQKNRDGSRQLIHALEPSHNLDRKLRWLRVPVLLVILYFTYRTGELIFRSYDPYYILFSFHGHDVFYWSYLILALILAGIIVFPMAWCRYLCPLGVSLWPFSKMGRMRLVRNDQTCTQCHACDRACPMAIQVSTRTQITQGDCTLCFKCLDACPIDHTLILNLR